MRDIVTLSTSRPGDQKYVHCALLIIPTLIVRHMLSVNSHSIAIALTKKPMQRNIHLLTMVCFRGTLPWERGLQDMDGLWPR